MKLGNFELDIQKDAVDKQQDGGSGVLRPSRICYLAIISTTFWVLVFFFPSMQGGDGMVSVLFKPSTFSIPLFSTVTVGQGPPSGAMVPAATGKKDHRMVTAPADDEPCEGRNIYMYDDLPPRFNADLIHHCRTLDIWMDMCPYVANHGMGQVLMSNDDEGGAFSDHGWYGTNQFMLDVIFHGRMKHYDCLTSDPARAAAVFVPFYASLDAGRYMWNSTSLRDALAIDLVEWLVRRPEWRATGGRDHFFVAGRTAVEFSRNGEHGWGTNLLHHPAVQNMTVLVLETVTLTHPSNLIAVPYPTYFHPEAAADVAAWQDRVRKAERTWLFSFAGAPRPGNSQTVRAQIIQQCGASSRCSLYRCGGAGAKANCYNPGGVMRLMESSRFCLQPRGDSLTRRSTFDAVLAGCIPVFFHPGSAYTQYTRHLPDDPNTYSVLILHSDITGPRNVSIEETLSRIAPETVKAMREEVIRLIPRVVYADPRSRRVDFTDAFNFTVEAVIDRVASRRRGGASSVGPEH